MSGPARGTGRRRTWLAAGLVLACWLAGGPAPAPGIVAPPSMVQIVLLSERIVEARVAAIDGDDLRLEGAEVLRGPARSFPAPLSVTIRPGISELGAIPVRAAPGDPILLLLAKEGDEGLGLVTGDAHSTVTARSLLHLSTADLHGLSYAARRAAVLGAFDLAARLDARPRDDQGPLLAAALRGDNALAREAALAWYGQQRRGHASRDMALLGEKRDTKPPLPDVERELLALVLPRKGELSTLSQAAADLLSLHGVEHWLDRLGSGPEGEIAFLVLAGSTEDPRPELRKSGGSYGAAVTYLRDALLAKRGDRPNLGIVLRTELPEEAAAPLRAWRHVPAWPPRRMLGWIAGRDFPDDDAARTWIEGGG